MRAMTVRKSPVEDEMQDTLGKLEIPSEMRKVAEQSVEQAQKAFDGFISAAQRAAGTADRVAVTARTGAKDFSEKAFGFAERNIAASFDFARRLLQAKDLQEVTQLQSEYIRSQMKALAEQAQELGQTAFRAVPDTKPDP